MTPRKIISVIKSRGLIAWEESVPIPMGVSQNGKIIEVVSGGICGFAWVKVPNRGKFAKFLIEKGIGHKGSEGGVTFSPNYFLPDRIRNKPIIQSYTKQSAWCGEVVKALAEMGIPAQFFSRVD